MKQTSTLPEGITYLDARGIITKYNPLHGAADKKQLPGKNFFALCASNTLPQFDYAEFLESGETTKAKSRAFALPDGSRITFFRINYSSAVVLYCGCGRLTIENLFQLEPTFSIQDGELIVTT